MRLHRRGDGIKRNTTTDERPRENKQSHEIDGKEWYRQATNIESATIRDIMHCVSDKLQEPAEWREMPRTSLPSPLYRLSRRRVNSLVNFIKSQHILSNQTHGSAVYLEKEFGMKAGVVKLLSHSHRQRTMWSLSSNSRNYSTTSSAHNCVQEASATPMTTHEDIGNNGSWAGCVAGIVLNDFIAVLHWKSISLLGHDVYRTDDGHPLIPYPLVNLSFVRSFGRTVVVVASSFFEATSCTRNGLSL